MLILLIHGTEVGTDGLLQHGLMNHPSNCTIKAVRDYFFDGTLPERGTECQPNEGIFEYAATLAEQVSEGGA